MSIKVTCLGCGTEMTVGEDDRGSRVVCPECGDAVLVPHRDLNQMQEGTHAGLADDVLPGGRGASERGPKGPSGQTWAETGGQAAGRAGRRRGAPVASAEVVMCPSCAHAIPPGSEQCDLCGYNLRTGRHKRVGVWWDQPTLFGWHLTAMFIVLYLMALWYTVLRVPALAGSPAMRSPFARALLMGNSLFFLAIAAGLWRGSDLARTVWFVWLFVTSVIWVLVLIFLPPPGPMLASGWAVFLVFWFSGSFLLVARHPDRKTVALGFGITLVGVVAGALTVLLIHSLATGFTWL